MAATPFKGIMEVKDAKGNLLGSYAFSCSDVANAFATFDNSGLTFVSMPRDGYISDIVLTAAGVDTTRLDLWGDNLPTPHTFNDASVKNTIQRPRISGIPVVGKTTLQLKQIA